MTGPLPLRIHGEPGATYESAATRKFQRGRTETIRSCSVESLDFCRAMLEPDASPASKVEALKNAINAHKEYARDVSARGGRGVVGGGRGVGCCAVRVVRQFVVAGVREGYWFLIRVMSVEKLSCGLNHQI